MATYRLLRFAFWLARFMPPRVMYWLCWLTGSVVYFFVPEVRRAVRDNMRHVLPDSNDKQRRRLSRNVIRNVYKNYYDLSRLPRMKAEDIEQMMDSLDGLEHLEEAVKRGKGVILLSGHMGNFMLVAQLAPIKGYTAATIAENIEPPQLYNLVNKLRGTFGLKLIKMGSAQMRTIFRFLRDGHVLVLAADRDVNDSGALVPFFDEHATLPDGPVVLSMRLGAPIVPCFTLRLSNNKSQAVVYPPLEMQNTGDYKQDFQANMRKMAEFLEQMIIKAPDQWVVLQRVWDDASKIEAAADADAKAAESPASEGTQSPNGTSKALANGKHVEGDLIAEGPAEKRDSVEQPL